MDRGVALVTGASRGIGRGIALALAEAGFDIAAGATAYDPSNTEKGLGEVKPRIEALGRRFHPIVGDLGDLYSHAALVAEAVEALGSIDLLVNNAGVAPLERLDMLETTPDSFDRLMRINLRGPFFFTQHVARQMIRQVEQGADRTPRILFITSISADTASPDRAEYCVSKAGLAMTAQNFAVRLAPHGIPVHEIRPGIIATDMTAAVQQKYDDLIADGLLLQPRWGTPDDIGKAATALATGHFDYATGAIIEIGGGFGVKRL
jgi:3-oxoacyl-[acyl-carrier protein] reductase